MEYFMDYFILKTKAGNYVCVNHVTRCKDAAGKDVIQFLSSGVGQQIPTEDIVGIFPSTPTPGTVL